MTAKMTDIHCHLPFQVSDGPASIDDAKAILDRAARDGVTYITAVAHYGQYLKELEEAVGMLGDEANKLGVELYPSFEYDYVHLDDVKPEALRFIGPNCRYILLDFHRDNIPYSAPMRLFELMEKNIGIVIVHPEKLFKAEALPMLQRFVDGGMVLQVNALSFLPDSPPRVRKMTHLLMRKGLVHVVASDAHRKEGVRRHAMAEARKIVEKTYGAPSAELLFELNPRRLLEDAPPFEMPERPNWWERLKHRWTGME